MKMLCQVSSSVLLAVLGMGVLGMSFWAVFSICNGCEKWSYLDYWLTWFSFFSFVIGLIIFCIGTFATSISITEWCSRQR